MGITAKAKTALLHNFSVRTDNKGYVGSPEENLLPGVNWPEIKADLSRGDGDELRTKFCAVHSSSALAVNCFGPFKDNPDILALLGRQSARHVEFERKLPIFRGGTAPNIDIWIDRGDDIVAVESKLLEYLTPKRPVFSKAYEKLAPPLCEPSWWKAFEAAKRDAASLYLDRAQLLKHYFGLNKFRKDARQAVDLTLLYIFWEPLNWQQLRECRQHREELEAFADAVSNSQIPFRWKTYNDLWEEWVAIPSLATHALRLKDRYQVVL
jgi:hypothetical protein